MPRHPKYLCRYKQNKLTALSHNCFESFITALCVSATCVISVYLQPLRYSLQKPLRGWQYTDNVNWPGYRAALPWPCGVHTSSSFFKPTPLLIRRETKTTHIQWQACREVSARQRARGEVKKLQLFAICGEFWKVYSPGFSFTVSRLEMVGCKRKQEIFVTIFSTNQSVNMFSGQLIN